MMNNILDDFWNDIASSKNDIDKSLQRLVCVDSLYRIYIGITDIPGRRFISLEIPKSKAKEFTSFTLPQGFIFKLEEPQVKHDGYNACILQAASSDQNDVFTIIAYDIINCLQNQKDSENYVMSLKKRIDKWKNFFKDPVNHRLSEEHVIGLLGELWTIKTIHEQSLERISELWNGPIHSSQDFQGNDISIEVKTSSSNKLEAVHISSEMQLDNSDKEALFLIVYRVERNDGCGWSLPELINHLRRLMSDFQLIRFNANLLCLGYRDEDEYLYDKKKYSFKEYKVYQVQENFPRITVSNLPKGICDTTYKLYLQNCSAFEKGMEDIITALREVEFNES